MFLRLWTSSCSLFVYRQKEPRGQKNFWVFSCGLSVGRTGCNSQLPDLRKCYWKLGLFIFYTFCFSVRYNVSQILRLLPFELYGPIYTDFNKMRKRKKGSTFSSFLPQSAIFLPACVSVNMESGDSKGTLPFFLYMLFFFLLLFALLVFFPCG